MPDARKPLIRPRSVLIAVAAVLVLALGGYAYFLANLGGYLPWQEDPTPISNDITPFAGEGFENLPTTPPRRTATSEPTSVSSPAASPASSPISSPEASPAASDSATLDTAQKLIAQPQPTECAVCSWLSRFGGGFFPTVGAELVSAKVGDRQPEVTDKLGPYDIACIVASNWPIRGSRIGCGLLAMMASP